MPRTASRASRWADATSSARSALEAAQQAQADLDTAFDELRDLQSEYSDWRDGLAEVSRGTAMEEKLDAVCDLDLEPDTTDLQSVESALDEAEAADLPLGFGRD